MKFISKYRRLRVLIRPTIRTLDNLGNVHITQEGLFAVFEKGAFHTEDAVVIKKLRSNKRFGIDIFEEVARDDMTVTGSQGPVYVCSKRDCRFQANDMETLQEHKVEAHPKKKKKAKRGRV